MAGRWRGMSYKKKTGVINESRFMEDHTAKE
jgi:hypothetical protein